MSLFSSPSVYGLAFSFSQFFRVFLNFCPFCIVGVLDYERKRGMTEGLWVWLYWVAGGSTRAISSWMVFLSLPRSSRPVFISTSACFASSVRSSWVIAL